MSILIFLAVLFILVLVHEFGHFIVAKKTGMRVDEFAIGFPPRLFGITKGETLYAFNALPVGGYVKIFGEDAIAGEETPDSPRAFTSKPKWAQVLVLIAGVSMNILLAWLLFIIVFAVGVQTAVSEAEATAAARLLVTDVLPESPAAEAGVSVGSEIIAVQTAGASLETLSPSAFTAFTSAHAEDGVDVTYRIGEEEKTVTLVSASDVLPDEADRKVVGVALALIETVPMPITEAIVAGTTFTFSSLWAITTGIASLLADAVQFDADFSQVAGPVGIVGLVGDASAFGITSLLMFTAFISLNLAVINLLPFPALDGGRLLFVLIEAVKGSPIKASVATSLNMIGFFILILLMVAVTVSDVLKLV